MSYKNSSNPNTVVLYGITKSNLGYIKADEKTEIFPDNKLVGCDLKIDQLDIK